MTNKEIITAIASRREVERIVNATCGKPVADLSQMIYEALMKMSNERLSKLEALGQLRYYIVGVARRQFYSNKSAYHKQQRRQPNQMRLRNAI